MSVTNYEIIEKMATGIPGFDLISHGGFTRGRTTLVSGTSGSAKTVFAVQYLTEGIEKFDESGVFVTFEESPADICKNMMGCGWDIKKWEKQGKWAFVDASFKPEHNVIETGTYNLSSRYYFANVFSVPLVPCSGP